MKKFEKRSQVVVWIQPKGANNYSVFAPFRAGSYKIPMRVIFDPQNGFVDSEHLPHWWCAT